MNERILVVEDDLAISRMLHTNLSIAGYRVTCALDGREAVMTIRTDTFDLALLDIMLPEIDGFELMPYMQEKHIPVMYVSAKVDTASRVQGLRMGAEDYLVKPFDMMELLVRMEKVLARRHPHPEILSYADVTLEEASHTVHKEGRLVAIKPMEYELLRTFILHPGMVLTRENLLRMVWGDAYIGETRTVDVHVASLRRKLGWEERITTVYKLGYRLEAEA